MKHAPASEYARRFASTLLRQFALMFVPLPIGVLRSQLAGRDTEQGELRFYAQANFVCTMHLIWLGWLAALGVLYDGYAQANGWSQIPIRDLSWPWLLVLVTTLLVLGLRFGRAALVLLISGGAIIVLAAALYESFNHRPVLREEVSVFMEIPVVIGWGVPFFTSLVLGLVFLSVATWRRLNNCWVLEPTGNFLEHHNFQEKDVNIAKGDKTFTAEFPCLVRRYLFFGLGDIVVHDSSGSQTIQRIENVFFARRCVATIEVRFGTTDIAVVQQSAKGKAKEI